MLAPTGTPNSIIEKLNKAIVKILKTPEMNDRLAVDGSEAVGNSPLEFGEHIKAETAKWRKLIKELDIKGE
jgi:tripartite-type tricarboxylate transporter receptor subunit TctC